jgi:hypothetical protein
VPLALPPALLLGVFADDLYEEEEEVVVVVLPYGSVEVVVEVVGVTSS